MAFIEWINSLAIGTVFENKYLLSLLIVIVFAMMGGFVLFIFTKYLQRFASKTKNKIDDLVFHNVKGPLFLVIVGYGIKLGLLNLQVNGTITKVVNSVMAIVFLYAIMKGIDIIIETWAITFSKRTKSNLDDVLLPMLQKVTKVLFVVIGLIWVLKIWNIDITPYLAGVWIRGILLRL